MKFIVISIQEETDTNGTGVTIKISQRDLHTTSYEKVFADTITDIIKGFLLYPVEAEPDVYQIQDGGNVVVINRNVKEKMRPTQKAIEISGYDHPMTVKEWNDAMDAMSLKTGENYDRFRIVVVSNDGASAGYVDNGYVEILRKENYCDNSECERD